MKIMEDSAERLVLKEGALTNRIVGGVLIIAGLIVLFVGLAASHSQPVLALVGGGLAVIGIVLLLLSKSDIVTADIAGRKLSVVFRSLKNRQAQSQTCSFDDIAEVQLVQQYQMVSNGPAAAGNGVSFGNNTMQQQIKMNLTVQLRNGAVWSIANETHQASFGLGVTSQQLVKVGQRLATVLGVSFREQGASTLGDVATIIADKFHGNQVESLAPSGVPPAPAAPIAPVPPVSEVAQPFTPPVSPPPSEDTTTPPQV